MIRNRYLYLLFIVFVLIRPGASFAQNNPLVNIDGPSVVCQGVCHTLIAMVKDSVFPPPYTYLWSTGSMMAGISFCPVQATAYAVTVTSANGRTASAQKAITVLPKTTGYIVSNNEALCNFDTTENDNPGCEKVCPFSTVTYSIQGINPGSQTFINWKVSGALSYAATPPFNTSVTVIWGNTGAGSVSAVVDGGPIASCGGDLTRCITIVEPPKAHFITDPPATGDTLVVCKGQTVYFLNQSAAADRYAWYFENGSGGSGVDENYIFQNPGIYAVSLAALSDCACTDTARLVISVLDAPAPSLDCVGTVCPGEQVSYAASNACPPFAWSVTGGTVVGGGTPASDSITVQWNDVAQGAITLGAQPCAAAACPIPATTRIPIVSDLAEIKGRERVCPSVTETYSIDAFGGTDFNWTLSGGGIIREGQGSNQVSVEWTAAPDGNTTHWLSVEYNNCYLGCSGRDSIGIRILSPMFIDGPAEQCENTDGNFLTKLSIGNQNTNADWTLTGPDGKIVWMSGAPVISAAPSFSAGPGLYRLRATPVANTQTCSDEAERIVTVAAQPPKLTGILGDRNICPGNTYTYEVTGGSAQHNILWTVQNGSASETTARGNPFNITWNPTGPYKISALQISADGLGCSADTVQLIAQTLGALNISGASIVCEDARAFYKVDLNAKLDYQWSIVPADAGAIVKGQGSNSVEIFWSLTGNHTVELGVCGSKSTFAVTVPVKPAPVVDAPTGVCTGKKADIKTTAPYNSYVWKNAAGADIATTPNAQLGAGSYAVFVTDAAGCMGSATFTLPEHPAPNFTITTTDPTGFCNNSRTVSIKALTNTDGDYTYQWFQNGNPVGGDTPIFSTNQYGAYTARITSRYGCQAEDGTILVYETCVGPGAGGGFSNAHPAFCPPGTLDVAFSPTGFCDSFQFRVLAGPDYLPGSANWTFGKSGNSTIGFANGDTVAFKFPNAGQYLTVLFGSLRDGSICVAIDSVRVDAAAQFAQPVFCPGSAGVFDDISTFLPDASIAGWQWDFGDPSSGVNNTSTLRNPNHAYAAPGNYTASLTVTAPRGCVSTFSAPVQVPATAPPVIAPLSAVCAGNATPFSVSADPAIVEIKWTFGNPSSGAVNDATGFSVFHNFAAVGSYVVTATALDVYGCTASATRTVTINPNILTGVLAPANPLPLCEGKSLTLTAPGGGGVQWLWSDSTTTSKTLVVSKEGIYTVTLTDTSGCTFSPPPVTIDVIPEPDAVIKAFLSNAEGQVTSAAYNSLGTCAGKDVLLLAQTRPGGSYGYQWSNNLGTGNQISFTEGRNNLLPPGTTTYTVTITDFTNGCSAVSQPFTVVVNPVPALTPISGTGNCASNGAELSYTGPDQPGWQYRWNNGRTGRSVQVDEPGLYHVRVFNEFGCSAKSNDWLLRPGPPANALSGGCHARCRPDTLCMPQLPNLAGVQWLLDGAPIAAATHSEYIATQNGVYQVDMTDVFGCTQRSDAMTLTLVDGDGTVFGRVWSDVNANGLIDAADTLLTAVPVTLLTGGTATNNGFSGATGIVSFPNLPGGAYTLRAEPGQFGSGWRAVIGQAQVDLTGCGGAITGDLLLARTVCTPLSGAVALSACAGKTVVYNNVTLAAGAVQDFTFKNAQGCDSTVTVSVMPIVPTASAINVRVCPEGTYDYNGALLNAGETQIFTFQNFRGCDSIVTVTVSETPNSSSKIDVKVCADEVFEYLGIGVAPGEIREFDLTNWLGCDSVVTVAVSAYERVQTTLRAQVCPNEVYRYNGTIIEPGKTDTFIFPTANGCDSVVTVTVTGIPPAAGTFEAQTCEGTTYRYAGFDLAAGETRRISLTGPRGCDSIVTVAIKSIPLAYDSLLRTLCPGETFRYAGVELRPGEQRQFTLTGPRGCDSIVTVRVMSLPNAKFNVTADSICAGAKNGVLNISDAIGGQAPYLFSIDGKTFEGIRTFDGLAPGRYTVIMRDSNNCRFEQEAVIATYPNIELSLANALIPCDTPLIVLEPGVKNYRLEDLTFLWSNGARAASTIATEPGRVWVEASNSCGKTRKTAQVEWAPARGINKLAFVPNVFRPRAGTPENALFRPLFKENLLAENYRFEVFDRWGSLMYRSTRPGEAWEGLVGTQDVQPGVYVWRLEAQVAFCGRIVQVREFGDVTVLR